MSADRGRGGADENSAGRLVAVDGVHGAAVKRFAAARVAEAPKRQRGGVSVWDASGVFADLMVAGRDAGHPSARTLVLLYAADLAFRLRWEIRPALAEGRTVAAAPYTATAIAFGRAAGLPAAWLKDLFAFAAKPDVTHYLDVAPPRRAHQGGFVDFGCELLAAGGSSIGCRAFMERARRHLRRAIAS